MVNSILLKETIRKKGTTITALAPKLNLTRENPTKKIDGTNEFKACDSLFHIFRRCSVTIDS